MQLARSCVLAAPLLAWILWHQPTLQECHYDLCDVSERNTSLFSRLGSFEAEDACWLAEQQIARWARPAYAEAEAKQRATSPKHYHRVALTLECLPDDMPLPEPTSVRIP